jgi:Na+/H+ antiporter NhaD/arsenite permease-like protein
MLIGQVLRLPFGGYLALTAVPVVLGLVTVWLIIVRHTRPATAIAGPTDAQLAALAAAARPFDRWQTAKGLIVALGLVVVFLATDWPRDVAALVGAGVLLLSQRFHSSTVMGLIDWELLVLSNLVSNVPAVMLLLPVAGGAHAGSMLALVSTLAGNLLIVGSIANIIVVDAARKSGVEIDWRAHARVGVPVTAITLAIAAAWLWLRG